MKYVPDRTGRFPERPHYDPRELDIMFERIVVEFLKSRYGKVEFPIKTDDLTVLIERDVQDLDQYADLSAYGDGVEGVTEFVPGRKPRVRIAQHLGASENRENRFRTTLTHEFGHVTLHAYLFGLQSNVTGLFPNQRKADVIACKRETMVAAAKTDWMEWQAGYACGAVLMPASHARRAVEGYRTQANIFGPVAAATEQGQTLIRGIMDAFQVSQEAARVRLSVLGILGTPVAAKSLFG